MVVEAAEFQALLLAKGQHESRSHYAAMHNVFMDYIVTILSSVSGTGLNGKERSLEYQEELT